MKKTIISPIFLPEGRQLSTQTNSTKPERKAKRLTLRIKILLINLIGTAAVVTMAGVGIFADVIYQGGVKDAFRYNETTVALTKTCMT